MAQIQTYLRLTRPANVVTAVADVLAGVAISGYLAYPFGGYSKVILLCLSTMCLYAGGIVFNDVFDADLDRVERPERAIPRGDIRIGQAGLFGTILLISGVILAFSATLLSGITAVGIAIAALMYNKFSKHYSFLGPLNMGICRGLNLWLGLSILTFAFNQWEFLGIVPLIYIFSITMISRGEVHGGSSANLSFGGFLYLIVIAFILVFAWSQQTLDLTALFLLPFAWMIFKPLFAAMREPVGKNIGKAVKAGVISLILMDAAWAACFGFPWLAVFIACLLPFSLLLAKKFAVT